MNNMTLVRIQTVIAFGVPEPLHNSRLCTACVIVLHIDALVDLNGYLPLSLVVEAADDLSKGPAIELLQYLKAICNVISNNDLIEAALSIETVVIILI
jgi:hypothetical protein